MQRRAVVSDSLSSIGYDPDTNVLEIEFRSRAVYRYFAVPKSVFEELMEDPSKGTYFVERIKDVFAFQRMH